jgi:hypothetical protein
MGKGRPIIMDLQSTTSLACNHYKALPGIFATRFIAQERPRTGKRLNQHVPKHLIKQPLPVPEPSPR